MKKYKYSFIGSLFDSETNITYATIETKLGAFTGSSCLQPCDEGYKSSYRGSRYAEAKAFMKYLKAIKRQTKAQLSAIEGMYNTIACGKKFNPNSYEARKIRSKIYSLKEEVENISKEIEQYHNSFLEGIKRDDIFLKREERKRMDKNN